MFFSSYLFIIFFLPLALLEYYAASKKLRHLTLRSSATSSMDEIIRGSASSACASEVSASKGQTVRPRLGLRRPVLSIVQSFFCILFTINLSSCFQEKIQSTTVDALPTTNRISATRAKPVIEAKLNSETQPMEKLESEEKPLPAAVPVVTLEEAKQLNAFAVFLSDIKTTVIEGEITERSELPDPQKSDYPNCRFTVHFTGNSIISGVPCPKETALILEGFENYRTLETDKVKQGDKVKCHVIPFDVLPDELQSTQQADDLNLFLLENYYAIEVKKINSFSDNELMPKSGIFFSDGNTDYTSVFERHINPPIPQDVIDAQKDSIRKELLKMNHLLDQYNDDKVDEINKHFADVWKKEKEKDKKGYNRIGNYVWRNVDNSFWCLPINYSILSKPELLTQETLDCFAALKKACEENGVQLIVALVPGLHVISARVINKDFMDVIDIQTATFVKQLSEIGVEAFYPSDAIIKNYDRYPFAFFYPFNGHPSDTVQDVITDILSEKLARYHLKPTLDHNAFSEIQSPHYYGNDEKYLFPSDCDIGKNEAGEAYTNREFLYNGNPIPLSKNASVIIIGNSYMQTPMKYPDSIPSLLSYKLNTAMDWYRIGGYGPFSDIIVQFLTRADFFLENKKVMIFYVGTDHLSFANKNGTILNIARLDRTRVILNNKKLLTRYIPMSNAESDSFLNEEIWGSLSVMEKSCFSIKQNGETLSSFKLNFGNDIVVDNSKPLTCIIPTACFPQTSCTLSINNLSQTIPSFHSRFESKFFNLSFELPPGTEEITMKAEGTPGTMFVIKDIQLWQ